jgi:hypothetical protein
MDVNKLLCCTDSFFVNDPNRHLAVVSFSRSCDDRVTTQRASLGAALDDEDDEETEYDPGMWWLAKSPDGSRFLLVHTQRVVDRDDYRAYQSYPDVANSADHHGCTMHTYAAGFHCQVLWIDTSQLLPPMPWERIRNLGVYSLFLGLNYPIIIPVGGEEVGPELIM